MKTTTQEETKEVRLSQGMLGKINLIDKFLNTLLTLYDKNTIIYNSSKIYSDDGLQIHNKHYR
jgi:hypothetical protein